MAKYMADAASIGPMLAQFIPIIACWLYYIGFSEIKSQKDLHCWPYDSQIHLTNAFSAQRVSNLLQFFQASRQRLRENGIVKMGHGF